MTEPAKEPDLQTMTAVGKVLVTDDSTALLLGLLGYSATNLWNTAVWHTKEVWKTTGKIPSYAKMDVAIKQERPLWYRCLAQPAVNRFAWRETRPVTSAHKPGTWQTSLLHLRTESAAALCGFRA